MRGETRRGKRGHINGTSDYVVEDQYPPPVVALAAGQRVQQQTPTTVEIPPVHQVVVVVGGSEGCRGTYTYQRHSQSGCL